MKSKLENFLETAPWHRVHTIQWTDENIWHQSGCWSFCLCHAYATCLDCI